MTFIKLNRTNEVFPIGRICLLTPECVLLGFVGNDPSRQVELEGNEYEQICEAIAEDNALTHVGKG